MNTIKKFVLSERFFLGSLVSLYLLRLAYATSRDIFSSGPDAPFYAVAPLNLAKYGLFSDQIEGIPFYPSGYPIFLWPFAEFTGSNWVTYAQILQIFLSVATVWFVYKISNLFFGKFTSLGIGYLFLLNPSFSAMSGQAMYEPFLMFTFYAYLYLILKEVSTSQKFSRLITAALLGGLSMAIHPRSIPWILVTQLVIFQKLKLKRSLIFFGVLVFPVILFLMRNGLVNDRWTLMSSGVLDPYAQSNSFAETFRNGIANIFYFWSPLSGDAHHSTWYHNFTAYHYIKQISGSTSFVVALAIIIGVILFASWLYGASILLKSKPVIGRIVLIIPFLAMGTDFFAAGDSRHRLVVIPLLIIGQITIWIHLIEKFKVWTSTEKVRKIWMKNGV